MTHLHLITTQHTTTHNTLQVSKAVEDTYTSYYATDDFMQQLLFSLKQGSLFTAMRRINEINSLNGYKVVTDYQIATIRKHFRENKSGQQQRQNTENEMQQSQKGKFKVEQVQRENVENETKRRQKEEYIKRIAKDMQKGYMKMLATYQ